MTNTTNAPTEWVTVPREVTQAMAKAATDAWLDCGSRLTLNRGMAAVRAAIAKGSEAAPPAPEAAEPDVADIIAGALQTSRAHAYELMREALKGTSDPAPEFEDDAQALDVLKRAGIVPGHDGIIRVPVNHALTPEARCAIDYLCDEWGYDCIRLKPLPAQPSGTNTTEGA